MKPVEKLPDPKLDDKNQLKDAPEPISDRKLLDAGQTNAVSQPKLPEYEHISDEDYDSSEGEEMKHERLVDDDATCGGNGDDDRKETKSGKSTDEDDEEKKDEDNF